ncbi:MAG: cation transporter [bacterium]
MKMNRRMKSALVSVVIITIITVVKFLFFWLSDSVAVYSESWHSFTDVATSLLVFLFIWLGSKKDEHSPEVQNEQKNSSERGFLSKLSSFSFGIHPEVLISLFISFALTLISVFILYNVFYAESLFVKYPLVVGLVFIVLSVFSYFLYGFQKHMSELEGSAALEADSLHSRSDMIISLFTGFSLILYHFGINIDKITGIVIAVFIFSFSVELFVSAAFAAFRKESIITKRFGMPFLIRCFSDLSFWSRILTSVASFMNIKKEKRDLIIGIFKKYVPRVLRFGGILIIVVLFLLWLSSCFFSVGPEQVAYRMRFGAVINPENPVESGLHLKYPFPVDSVIKFRTKRIYSMHIGNAGNKEIPMIWSKKHGDLKKFISGDNNFLLPYLTVEYRVKDPYKYYFGHKHPEKLMRNILSEILNRTFVRKSFYDIVVYDRREWIKNLFDEAIEILDKMDSGIEFKDVFVKDVHPPSNVAASFENVVASEQVKQKRINISKQYSINLLGRKKSEARAVVLGAGSYSASRIMKAQGQAFRYENMFQGFMTAPREMMFHMRMQKVQSLLKNKKLTVYDPQTGIRPNFLYMRNFMRGGKER